MLSIHEYDKLKSNVISWVSSMQISPVDFRMNVGADSTIFTSCFALFIYDLFQEVSIWSQKERDIWIDYINSFQDKDSGYFIPKPFFPNPYKGTLKAKPVHQLTCFCISALEILGANPKFKLSFINQWREPKHVYKYLQEHGCFDGTPGSGNMAMFLAIFLTYKYEKEKNLSALENLESWFYWHNKTQNIDTGFWGNSKKNKYYSGFQNAFHQFIIYNYWKKEVPFNAKIIDLLLSIQDNEGHFYFLPGGNGCYDFDSADILINLGYKINYRKKDIGCGLINLLSAIIKNQNEDGGFCESKRIPSSMKEVFYPKNLSFIFSKHNLFCCNIKFQRMLNIIRIKKNKIFTHWTKHGRKLDQSNLWDTWSRCLTIAEIDTILDKNSIQKSNWNFHKFIGLGFFREND